MNFYLFYNALASDVDEKRLVIFDLLPLHLTTFLCIVFLLLGCRSLLFFAPNVVDVNVAFTPYLSKKFIIDSLLLLNYYYCYKMSLP